MADDESYNSPAYKAWKFAVMKRDQWICGSCGRKGGEVQVHHIKRWADYPELRYVVSNGITLCKVCHDEVTGREEQFEEQFRRAVAFKSFEKKQNKGATKVSSEKKTGWKPKWYPRNPNQRY
jgi:5-methylcytosine-specific restriction endonuclease McrA